MTRDDFWDKWGQLWLDDFYDEFMKDLDDVVSRELEVITTGVKEQAKYYKEEIGDENLTI